MSCSRVRMWPFVTGLVTASLVAAAAAGEANVDGFRAKVEKWVETRQVISEEASDWTSEKESLIATRKLLEQEKQALAKEVAELTETSTAADDERLALLTEREDYQLSAAALEAAIRDMEEAVLELVPLLPQPLQTKLEVLVVQIPVDPPASDARLGQRLMNVLGVLAQAEKWNGTATFVGETRKVSGGDALQVRTLYWGLGQAIYVDARGDTAGTGRPAEAGWEFADDPELADAAGRLLDIYEGNVDAIEFVPFPIEIR